MNDKCKVSFSAFDYDAPSLPDCKEVVRSGYDYVSWGSDNKFPNELYNMYLNSAILQSIINGICDYIFGGGINSGYDVINLKGDLFSDVVKKCVFDYIIFGGFSLQVVYKSGKPENIYWLDFQKVRKSEDETKIYYCDEWGKYNKKCLEYDAWTPETKRGTSIFYFKGHKTRGIYPIPMYVGALKSVKISTEISNFHLNNITNSFSANAIVSFNNGQPTETVKKEIERAFRDKFCSTANAGSFLLMFNESKDNAAEIARLESDDFDKKYESLTKSVKEDIFIAFRAIPELFGLPNENNGFSKEEYLEAFKLFNKTVIMPLQDDIERCFRSIGFEMKFDEFKIYDEYENNNE